MADGIQPRRADTSEAAWVKRKMLSMNRPPSSWKCPAIVRAVRVPTLQGSFGFWPLHALEATSGIRLKLTLTWIVRWISHGMGAHNPLDGSALLFFDSTRRGRHRRATRTVPRAINTHSEQGMSSFVITSIIFKLSIACRVSWSTLTQDRRVSRISSNPVQQQKACVAEERRST